MESGFFQNTIDTPNKFDTKGKTGITTKDDELGSLTSFPMVGEAPECMPFEVLLVVLGYSAGVVWCAA